MEKGFNRELIYRRSVKQVDKEAKDRVDRLIPCSGLVVLRQYPGRKPLLASAMLYEYSELLEYMDKICAREAWIDEGGYIGITEEGVQVSSRLGSVLRVYEIGDKRNRGRVESILEADNGFSVDFGALEPYLRSRGKQLRKWSRHKEALKIK